MSIVKLTAEITNEEGLTTIAQINGRYEDDSVLGNMLRKFLESIEKLSNYEVDATAVMLNAIHSHIDFMNEANKESFRPITDAIKPFI